MLKDAMDAKRHLERIKVSFTCSMTYGNFKVLLVAKLDGYQYSKSEFTIISVASKQDLRPK